VLLALGIGWLVWNEWLHSNSRDTGAPAVVAQVPVGSTSQPPAQPVPPAAGLESPCIPLEAETKAEPASAPAAPASTAPESAEILVRGTVRDEKGQPVPSAWLRWVDERGIETVSEVSAGAYSVAGLHAQRYVVGLGSSGWRHEQVDVGIDAQPALQQRDFTVHSNARVLIRILGTDGTPLIGIEDKHEFAGNRLRAYTSPRAPAARLDPDGLVRQASSEYGRFTGHWTLLREHPDIGADCLGEVEFYEPLPLFVSLVCGTAVVATRELTELPPEIVFTLDPSALRSQLAGLRVRLLQPDGKTPVTQGDLELFADSSNSAKADSEGRLELRDKLPGRYALTLRAAGCGWRVTSVVLEPGQILDLGDVVLAPGPNFSLRFVFPEGRQDQVMFVLKPEQPGDPLATLGAMDNSSYGTGDRDPYPLSGFEPGTYELRVLGLGDPRDHESRHLGARPMRVVIGDGAQSEIVVKIEPTTEICLLPPHETTGISRWIVSTADGLPCRRVRIEGRAPTRIGLVPGEYTIARIDPQTNSLGKAQAFTVVDSFLALELMP
jgi:hypothetical protein